MFLIRHSLHEFVTLVVKNNGGLVKTDSLVDGKFLKYCQTVIKRTEAV